MREVGADDGTVRKVGVDVGIVRGAAECVETMLLVLLLDGVRKFICTIEEIRDRRRNRSKWRADILGLWLGGECEPAHVVIEGIGKLNTGGRKNVKCTVSATLLGSKGEKKDQTKNNER